MLLWGIAFVPDSFHLSSSKLCCAISLVLFLLVRLVLLYNLLGSRTNFSLTSVLENEDSCVLLTYKEQQSPVSEGFLGGSRLYAKQTVRTRDTSASLNLKLKFSKIV